MHGRERQVQALADALGVAAMSGETSVISRAESVLTSLRTDGYEIVAPDDLRDALAISGLDSERASSVARMAHRQLAGRA